MDIEAVKANQVEAEARIRKTGELTDVGVWLALITHLPAAIELIEELRDLVWQVSRQSEHIDCEGPGCWWCGAEWGGPHKPKCVADAVLAKVKTKQKGKP